MRARRRSALHLLFLSEFWLGPCLDPYLGDRSFPRPPRTPAIRHIPSACWLLLQRAVIPTCWRDSLSARLSEIFNNPFVVEDVAGVGGVIAAKQTAAAPPDGYTLGLNDSGFSASASR